MSLNLVYPLKKGTYRRVRGYASHVRYNPGTWYGIDEACKTGTPLIASESGRISHSVKQRTGGGYNFRLNFTKYKGWFMWYAHNSVIPTNGKIVKRGQVIGKSGATGGVSGPHLHFSLMQGSVPKDPDNKNVVQWGVEDKMAEPWYKKSITAKITEISNLKKAVKSKATEISTLKKLSSQQKEHIKTLQKDLKQSISTMGKDSETIVDMGVDILTLKNKLQACQKGFQEPVEDVRKSWGSLWGLIKDIFKRG